jgi:glycine/D-amino acid oxidase-like deaminating enzyme
MTDVAVIGGGIAGCATAAFLAEAGAAVTLYEREAVAAGASGRNSGVVQHPMDPVLEPLHEASLELYAGLGHGFDFPAEPAGILVVAQDPAALTADLDDAQARFPALAPEWLDGAALAAVEPSLAAGLCAYRLATGRPVPPAAATRAWAERARAAGARVVEGETAVLARRDGRVEGVRAGGRLVPAAAVVVAAGPWTPAAVGARPEWRPVIPLWGVIAQVRLAAAPRHTVEQAGVESLTEPGGGPASLFSVVTANGVSAVGSTFTPVEPDAAVIAPQLVARGARYLPALRGAAIESVRACARPLSADGRPLLGPVPGVEGLHLVTGHGAWGISLGPGSARLVADGVMGGSVTIPPELAAARFGAP